MALLHGVQGCGDGVGGRVVLKSFGGFLPELETLLEPNMCLTALRFLSIRSNDFVVHTTAGCCRPHTPRALILHRSYKDLKGGGEGLYWVRGFSISPPRNSNTNIKD